ncbi:MAG: glycosyltransferase [Isosphaeraceae bacterium]
MSKRIGYFINQYPAPSQTFIRREIAALEALGATVQRYTARGWGEALVDPDDQAEAARVRRVLDVGGLGLLKALAKTALSRPRAFARAVATAWKLAALAGRRRGIHLVYLAEACVLREWSEADRVDHLHAHFGTNSAAVALLCRRLGGPPYSFTVHGPEEFDSPVALALGEKVKHAAFAVAICSYGRSQLWRWAEPADWPKVEVIHCGVDPRFLDGPATPPPDVPRFLSIGRLAEQKGQLILVEAAAKLRDQGRSFEVVVIGDGPLRGALEARIAALDLGATVRLVGWRSGDDVRRELLGARALVLPSFAEGLPVVIMEALALRRPVISTYVAGIPELVRPGSSGWLAPAGSVDDLVSAMAEALETPIERLGAMGDAGASQVTREFDARVEAGKLLARIASESVPTPGALH